MAFREPSAGDLNRRLDLLKQTQVPGGSAGLDESFATVASVWARARTLFGGRVLDGVQDPERASHVFTIRWRADWQSNAWDHVRFDGRLFEVRSVENPDEGRKFLEILCEEIKSGV